MKKAILFILLSSLLGLLSCGPTREEFEAMERDKLQDLDQKETNCPHKYQRGDVVEVKPDHQKVVIISFEEVYCPSAVYWVRRGDGEQEKLQQELIYGIAKDEEK